ncbi:hypothetical protein GGR56DRAFT_677239 [Xylariaceae sp. FL0804]|nr:hypothetical protein GGR56DRAFT_677239 [Xylariaceae sp. FL0804]
MDVYNVLTKVYQCGHEAHVLVPKKKWEVNELEPVAYIGKCDACDYPAILGRFRAFNRPSSPVVCNGKMAMYAFDLFDCRHVLSAEALDALMRHWMRGLERRLPGQEDRHRVLLGCVVQGVKESDGPLAAKQMRALLDSGYVRFVKNGRGYMRPIHRRQNPLTPIKVPGTPSTPTTTTSTTASSSSSGSRGGGDGRRSSSSSPPTPSSSRPPSRGSTRTPSRMSRPPVTPMRAMTIDEDDEDDEEELPPAGPASGSGSGRPLHSIRTVDEYMGLETEGEDQDRLREALMKLHKALETTGWTEHWGNDKASTQAQIATMEGFAKDLEDEKRFLEEAEERSR